MRRIMALALAGVLWLGMSQAAKAQFSLSIGNPWTGGLSIGTPYSGYYGGYGGYGGYGSGFYPGGVYGSGLYGGYGIPPVTTYSSGYSGYVPGISSYRYSSYYPAAGLGYVGGYRPFYGYAPYRYGYYGGLGGLRGFRRGFVGGIW